MSHTRLLPGAGVASGYAGSRGAEQEEVLRKLRRGYAKSRIKTGVILTILARVVYGLVEGRSSVDKVAWATWAVAFALALYGIFLFISGSRELWED